MAGLFDACEAITIKKFFFIYITVALVLPTNLLVLMEVKRAQVSMHCFKSLVGFACDWNFWNAACVLLLVPEVSIVPVPHKLCPVIVFVTSYLQVQVVDTCSQACN